MTKGDVVHGFAGGYYGRDSYACRTVVAVGEQFGVEFVVTWNGQRYELVDGLYVRWVEELMNERTYCSDDCEGPKC